MVSKLLKIFSVVLLITSLIFFVILYYNHGQTKKYGTVTRSGNSTIYKNYDLIVGVDNSQKVSLLGHAAFSDPDQYYSVTFEDISIVEPFLNSKKRKKTFSKQEYEWLLWVISKISNKENRIDISSVPGSSKLPIGEVPNTGIPGVTFDVPALSKIGDNESFKVKVLIRQDSENINLQFSPTMQAHCTSGYANIQRMTDKRQHYEDGKTTTWSWLITPKTEGKHSLYFTLENLESLNNTPKVVIDSHEIQTTILRNKTFIQKALTFFTTSWQFFVGTILLPFSLWLWRQGNKYVG